jgi:hypothetical protein
MSATVLIVSSTMTPSPPSDSSIVPMMMPGVSASRGRPWC